MAQLHDSAPRMLSPEQIRAIINTSGVDYWSDEGIIETAEAARTLDEVDWRAVVRGWEEEPVHVQERIAQLCGDVGNSVGCHVLVAMLDREEPVMVLAAESLTFLPRESWAGMVSSGALVRLRALATEDTLHGRMVRHFVEVLEPDDVVCS